jgi:hypothetical protein
VTWWHLQALAERLAELLPAQLELGLDELPGPADPRPSGAPHESPADAEGPTGDPGSAAEATPGEAPGAAERAVEAADTPHAPPRPSGSLRAAPGPSEPIKDSECTQGGGRRQRQARQRPTQERPEGDWTEVDIALWPILWGPRGVLGPARNRRRF